MEEPHVNAAAPAVVTLPACDPDKGTAARWLARLDEELAAYPADRLLAKKVRDFHAELLVPILDKYLEFKGAKQSLDATRHEVRTVLASQNIEEPDELEYSPGEVEEIVADAVWAMHRKAKGNQLAGILLQGCKVVLETSLAFIFVHRAMESMRKVLPSGDGATLGLNIAGLFVALVLVSVVQALISGMVIVLNALFKPSRNQSGAPLLASNPKPTDTVLISVYRKASGKVANVNDVGLRFYAVLLSLFVSGIAVCWFLVDTDTFNDYIRDEGVAMAMAGTVTMVLVGMGIAGTLKHLHGVEEAERADEFGRQLRKRLQPLRHRMEMDLETTAKEGDIQVRKDWACKQFRIIDEVLPHCGAPDIRDRLMSDLNSYLLGGVGNPGDSIRGILG